MYIHNIGKARTLLNQIERCQQIAQEVVEGTLPASGLMVRVRDLTYKVKTNLVADLILLIADRQYQRSNSDCHSYDDVEAAYAHWQAEIAAAQEPEIVATQEDGSRPWCNIKDPSTDFFCTLPKKHDGEHIAHGVGDVTMHRWPSNPENSE